MSAPDPWATLPTRTLTDDEHERIADEAASQVRRCLAGHRSKPVTAHPGRVSIPLDWSLAPIGAEAVRQLFAAAVEGRLAKVPGPAACARLRRALERDLRVWRITLAPNRYRHRPAAPASVGLDRRQGSGRRRRGGYPLTTFVRAALTRIGAVNPATKRPWSDWAVASALKGRRGSRWEKRRVPSPAPR